MPVTEDIATVLDGAAGPLGALLTVIPGAGPVIGPIVGQALGLAADLVRAGDDAAIVIERIRRSPDLLAKVRAEARWEARLDDRFPPASAPPGPDTDPAGPPVDIYEGAEEDGAQ